MMAAHLDRESRIERALNVQSESKRESEGKEREVKETEEMDPFEQELREQSLEELKETAKKYRVKPPKVKDGLRTKEMWIQTILNFNDRPNIKRFKNFIDVLYESLEYPEDERKAKADAISSIKKNKKMILINLKYMLSIDGVREDFYDLGDTAEYAAKDIYDSMEKNMKPYNVNYVQRVINKYLWSTKEEKKETEITSPKRGRLLKSSLQKYVRGGLFSGERGFRSKIEEEERLSDLFKRFENKTGHDASRKFIPLLTDRVKKRLKVIQEQFVINNFHSIPLAKRVEVIREMEQQLRDMSYENITKNLKKFVKVVKRDIKDKNKMDTMVGWVDRLIKEIDNDTVSLSQLDIIDKETVEQEDLDWVAWFLKDRYLVEYRREEEKGVSTKMKRLLTEMGMDLKKNREEEKKIMKEREDAQRRELERERRLEEQANQAAIQAAQQE